MFTLALPRGLMLLMVSRFVCCLLVVAVVVVNICLLCMYI